MASRPFLFGRNAGLVVGSPKVTVIFWGNYYGTWTGDGPGAQTSLNDAGNQTTDFMKMVVDSPYMDLLNEYAVYRGAFLGSRLVPHDPAHKENCGESDIASILTGWLGDPSWGIEAPDPTAYDHCYFVFPSPEISLHLTFLNITDFGGYHYSTGYKKPSIFAKDNVFFAVIRPGESTATVSHELAEMCSDRDFNGWHGLPAYTTEIGDISEGETDLELNGYPVSPYWRDSLNRSLIQDDLTPPPPPPPLKVMTVTVDPSPADLAVGTRASFTVTSVDAKTLAGIDDANVVLYNYTNGTPVAQNLGTGSKVSANTTLHYGRGTIIGVDGKPHIVFDKQPVVEVKAPGYSAVSVALGEDASL